MLAVIAATVQGVLLVVIALYVRRALKLQEEVFKRTQYTDVTLNNVLESVAKQTEYFKEVRRALDARMEVIRAKEKELGL